jgi:hypothetical protein
MNSMWLRNQGDYTAHDMDRWSGMPPDSLWAKWFGGIIAPAAILSVATRVIITQEGFMPGQNGTRLDLQGTDAILLGCCLLFFAMFLHTHYFWGNSRILINLHEAGKTISLLGFCISIIWLLFRIFAYAFGI